MKPGRPLSQASGTHAGVVLPGCRAFSSEPYFCFRKSANKLPQHDLRVALDVREAPPQQAVLVL